MTSRAAFNEAVPLQHRYEIVLLFDVTNGNPNGDPDADNQPRVDPETGHGLVTDVCIKRKVRNFVTLTQRDAEGYEIYVKERGILAREQKKAYTALGIEPDGKKIDLARDWMCKTFFDVRTFGAVMTTGKAEQEEDGESGKRGRSKGEKLWKSAWPGAIWVCAFDRSDCEPGAHHYSSGADKRRRRESRRAGNRGWRNESRQRTDGP